MLWQGGRVRERRGHTGPPLPVPVRPRPPTGSTARLQHGILKPEERIGANRSARATGRPLEYARRVR
jgi:hypothetical protein